MIKITEFFHRRSGMAQDAFLHHWQETHTQVVLGIPTLRRYVQNPVVELEHLTRQLGAKPYDGVVEVWFDDMEAVRQNAKRSYWPTIVADEEKFIDRSSLKVVLSEDNEPPSTETGMKLMSLYKRPATVSADKFRTDIKRLQQGLPFETDVQFPMTRWAERQDELIADALVGVRAQAGSLNTEDIEPLLRNESADRRHVTSFAVEERRIK